MVTIPRAGKWPPDRGQWFPAAIDGQRTARLTCPECGESYLLDHHISAEGVVTPSVDCPTKDCSWHVHVQLEGWERDAAPPANDPS